MKTIIVTRHAKSSWAEAGLADKDRPLNKRGIRDAPLMAELLRKHFPVIDQFYSSPANRAYTTASYFAKAYGLNQEEISIESDLYFGSEMDIMNVIHLSDPEHNTIIVFSHNPTITYFVNQFNADYIDNVPTCGVSILQSDENDWRKLNKENTKLIRTFFPKMDL